MYLRKLWVKIPKPREGNRYPGIGNTQGLEQDKPKHKDLL